MDNLPPSLLLKMVELSSRSDSKIDHLAAVIDVRGGEFFDELNESLAEMDRGGIPYRIIFLEADDATLIRRFKETRRSHPIQAKGGISTSIAKERELLQTLRGRADTVIDTSKSNIYQLREQLTNLYSAEGQAVPLEVSLISFGYKFGLPLDADMVFDLRFLPNPFWVEGLRDLDGTDSKVKEYILEQEDSREFLDRTVALMQFLKSRFIREGRRYMTLAFGCTGGRHRSVVMVEDLASRLKDMDWTANIRHRDVRRR